MPVSRGDVISAYRLVLDRDPENEDVVAAARGAADRRALLATFLRSEEARRRALVPLPGLHLHADRPAIDVACSTQQLDAMFDRIQTAWSRFGETEAHWSVLTHAKYASASIDRHLDEFYALGQGDVGRILASLKRADVDSTGIETVLDFGCGVGRITLALARQFRSVTGLDISAPHLAHATVRAAATGAGNVEFRHLRRIAELDAIGRFDLVVSFLVLQHNPPPVAHHILGRLLASLAPGGVAIFQIPTFLAGYRFSVSDYLASDAPQMEMNAVPQADIFRLLADHGCRVLEVREDLSIGDLPGVSQIFVAQKT